MNAQAHHAHWLRAAFKWLNRYMILHWRLGLGPMANQANLAGCIMVLVHKGRKSGQMRRTPVNYAIVDGDVYCVAGFGQISDWYRNLLADPNVEVWLPAGWYAGVAADVTDRPLSEATPIVRQVLANSGFAAHLAGIDAARMSDAELRDATKDYRLVRIRCTAARTGAGGPSDLAWLWPLTTAGLILLFMLRRRR